MTGDVRQVAVIDQLARQLLAERDPEHLLDRAVRLAADGIDAASSVSISLADKGRRIFTAAASDDLARAGDELQYQFGEGPCLDATWARGAVYCRNVDVDPRWPRWAPAAAGDLGVHSTLSLPLFTHQHTLGSVNLYSRVTGAFDPSALALGDSFATHTAVAYARALDQQNLQVALASRNLIGQAQGILMERYKITAERAFDVLATTSQQSNVKLVELARRVVDTGVTPPNPGPHP
jgi:GAF domain-containing protein